MLEMKDNRGHLHTATNLQHRNYTEQKIKTLKFNFMHCYYTLKCLIVFAINVPVLTVLSDDSSRWKNWALPLTWTLRGIYTMLSCRTELPLLIVQFYRLRSTKPKWWTHALIQPYLSFMTGHQERACFLSCSNARTLETWRKDVLGFHDSFTQPWLAGEGELRVDHFLDLSWFLFSKVSILSTVDWF